MYNHASKAFLDEEATSTRTSSQACQPQPQPQPSWMAHWTRKKSEADKLVDVCDKTDFSLSTLNIANGFSKQGKGVIKDSKEMLFGKNFKCEISGINHDFGDKNNLSLALALGRSETSKDLNLKLPHERSKGLFLSKSSALNQENLALCPPPPTHGSINEDTKKPLVVFERHFSNDNFTCLTKESCKYQKYSSFLVHETGTKNDLVDNEFKKHAEGHVRQNGRFGKNNFTALFGEQHPKGVPDYRNLTNFDSPSRNVETMRMCTVVDSIEKTPRGYQKICQRAHHVLFTKETCATLPSHCEDKTFGPFNTCYGVPRPSGVKIQPLWTSTESEEKETTGNSSVFKAGSKNEAFVEVNSVQENTCRNEVSSIQEKADQNRDDVSGRTSSPLHKVNTMAENNSPDKTETKRRLLNVPDINEDIRGIQPAGIESAVSSTDEDEPSTSRVHSLNAKHLFSNKKGALTQACNETEDQSVSPDPSNRWIKRLKLSSSDTVGVGTKSSKGESSSHQKFNMFFNRIMKCNKESLDSNLNKQHENDQESSANVGCSWIQRWCQNSSVPGAGPRPRPRSEAEPVVICEPHSLTLGKDEAAKKQFPSIGALALMGKAMNGYRSCEFSKRGSVVVWNTREF